MLGPLRDGKERALASETRPLADDDLIPSSVTIDALDIGAYDDPESRDVFSKAYSFELVKLAKEHDLYPFYKALDSNQGPTAIVDGKRVVMLGSNNYLGLTRHPRVMKAARDAVETYGTSMTGSRLMNGTTKIHIALEEKIAHFLRRESAMTFSTGYQANLGAILALVNRHAAAVIDKADHASIYDGTKLSDGEVHRFRHNEPNHLEQVLAKVVKERGRAALVVIDGVYSMAGDIAELPSIVDVCKRYGARLMVDDAHSIGVLGEGGRGTGSHFGLDDGVDLVMGTFSKSLASIGGFLSGPAEVMEWIRHFARPLVFSAAMAPSAVAAAATALDVLMDEPELVERLAARSEQLRAGLRKDGFEIASVGTPIVPIVIGDEVKMVGFWRELLERGVYANAVIWPAVGKGEAILRTSVMATHSEQHIDTAVEIMGELGRKWGLLN